MSLWAQKMYFKIQESFKKSLCLLVNPFQWLPRFLLFIIKGFLIAGSISTHLKQRHTRPSPPSALNGKRERVVLLTMVCLTFSVCTSTCLFHEPALQALRWGGWAAPNNPVKLPRWPDSPHFCNASGFQLAVSALSAVIAHTTKWKMLLASRDSVRVVMPVSVPAPSLEMPDVWCLFGILFPGF